jgi:rhomboid protease GluP
MELSPKLRFKLERWKNSLDAMFAGKESYDTSHRMCPNCRALVERGASECSFCGMKLRSPRARSQGLGSEGLLGGLLAVPSTACSVIILVTILVYAASWYLTQQVSSNAMVAAPSMGGINGTVLRRLGAKDALDIIIGGQWWRLVTAVFLHGGLLHIGMNLWCLFDLGPQVESLFGTAKFTVFYLVTGVAGFLVSLFFVPALSIGASGAILGLIGVLIGASFHHGSMGKAYRSMLGRWLLYSLVFFVFMPGIDNAAHIGGLVSGLALGYVVPEADSETVTGDKLWNVLALFAVIIIAGSFALMAMHLTQAAG